MKRTANAADRSFFANLFRSIAEEMGTSLARTAYSPNIKERKDFSCAVFDPDGSMIAQAAHIPVHLGAMPASVRAARNACAPFRPGDVILLNDPFAGGTHLPDITMVTPLFTRGKTPSAFLASRAHHADIGGMSPGSLPMSTSIYQEGLRIPPVRLVDAGAMNADILRMVLANVRTPREREGDLRAQLAAHSTGARRFAEAAERHGATVLRKQMHGLLDYGEAMMEHVIEAIPDGTYRFEDQLDGDGISDAPLPICVSLTIQGKRVTVDFTGTAPACEGSVNAVEAITHAAVYYCFLCLVVTPSRIHERAPGSPPLNTGCFRPITIHAPPGSLVNADLPHAVAAGNVETSQRIVDVVLGALSLALPDLIPAASQGTMNNLTLGGVHPETAEPYAYYETLAGGMGARPHHDGLDAVQAHMTNTLNTPVEALEFAYPFRIETYALRMNTGGKGAHRGGHGVIRELRVLGPAAGALLTERRDTPPYGLEGGSPGAVGRNTLIRNGKRHSLPAKSALHLEPGDVIRIETPGGGGYGK